MSLLRRLPSAGSLVAVILVAAIVMIGFGACLGRGAIGGGAPPATVVVATRGTPAAPSVAPVQRCAFATLAPLRLAADEVAEPEAGTIAAVASRRIDPTPNEITGRRIDRPPKRIA